MCPVEQAAYQESQFKPHIQIISDKQLLQTLRGVVNITNQLEERYVNEKTTPPLDGEEESEHAMIDASNSVSGAQILLEIIIMIYDYYVKLYSMFSEKIEVYKRARRGREI